MKPTTSQKDILRRANGILTERGIAFFTGLRNGKTFNLYELLRNNKTLTEYMAAFPKFTKENQLIFIEHVRFPRTHNITSESMMRMIMQAMGIPRNVYYGNIYDVRKAFADEMYKAQSQGNIFVLWIDNAENLPEKAYTVLKELNELQCKRDKRMHEIGLAVVMAGHHPAMNMPYWFMELSSEIMVGKIKADEIRDIIDELYPKEKHLFPPVIIQTLEKCSTSGVLRRALRDMIDDIRKIDLPKQANELSEIIDKMNEKVRLAA